MHPLRSSTAFISHKDQGVVCQPLKLVYQLVNARTAEKALEEFEQSAMSKKYPFIAQA